MREKKRGNMAMKRKMSIRSSALNEYLEEFKSKVLTGESIKECVERLSEGRKLFLQDLFRRHDKDSSGFICRDELEHVLRDLDVYGSDTSLKAGVDTMMHLFDKQRNIYESARAERKRKRNELANLIKEKLRELDRQNAQLDSLVQVEREQQALIEKLTSSD